MNEDESIVNVLKSKESLLAGKGASNDQVVKAEKDLGVSFAKDYKSYLLAYGIAAFDGQELTGITKTERLNVVSATFAARDEYENLPKDLYVIENTGVEGITVLQSPSGDIYTCDTNSKIEKLCDSLVDFVNGNF